MTLDMKRATEILKDALLRNLGDEVDLIFRYGSQISGAAHAYSDMDISYVPVHESTWDAITVMVDDVMVDLYPIHWSRLERMASFDDVSGSVILRNKIVYQRSDAVVQRFRALPDQLLALQKPEAKPRMIQKAMAVFESTGYQYYLLRQSALAGHSLACLHHSRCILQTVLHCLIVCNQTCADTRKLNEVLALAELPVGLAETTTDLTTTTDPQRLLSAGERLLITTRDLLIRQQEQSLCSTDSLATVFAGAYPELKGDLQHLMLACERQDMFASTLTSLYHELMIHMAQAFSGVRYSSFNSLTEYEQDLGKLGFPELLPFLTAGDYEGLHRQCDVFDQRLREFLTERSVSLNTFATLDELQSYLVR